jgi:hypothetical protein
MRQRFVTLILGCLVLVSALVSTQPRPVAAQDDSDAAWATIRATVSANQPLYRPTWLPDRFRQPGVAATQGPITGVNYISHEGDNLLFIYGGSNSCNESAITIEPVLVHGTRGLLGVYPASCYPQITANWLRGETSYTIAGNRADSGRPALSREELLHVIAGLALVGPDGAALPQPTSSATPDATCFEEAGRCAAGPFLDYWRANGGLAINGYPLTGEMLEQMEDGRVYQVQYFERARLEFHPENADTPYEVLLGQFGRRILASVPGAPTAPVPPQAGYRYFAETGHNVGPRFGAYWEANGGLAQFGFPLTEPFEQRLEDGNTYTVQYFERTRFELHPENPTPYDILLGQFGRRILDE